MKRFLYIFCSTVIIGFILYFGVEYQMKLREKSAITFNLNPYFIFTSIFPIFIGMLLRLPKWIIEMKENKKWSFDWIKFIIIGIPSFYLALTPILLIYFGTNILFSKMFIPIGDFTFTSICGVIFGYVLFDSLKRNTSTTNKVLE